MSVTRRQLFDTFRPWLDASGYTADRVRRVNGLCDALGLPANDNAAPANDNRPAPVVPPVTGLADARAFFAHLRWGGLLGPVLSQDEVDGCTAIVSACGADGWPIADVAYALGTAWHETAGTMLPIKEIGGTAYFTRLYDVRGHKPDRARRMGNTAPGDGARYCGRGYVQLTWKVNYARAGEALNVDLVANPDLAMDPAIAAAVMVRGMREGWFTGRDLDDDLPRQGPATLEQFVRSRDIINGTDKAEKIARDAAHFQDALIAGGWR